MTKIFGLDVISSTAPLTDDETLEAKPQKFGNVKVKRHGEVWDSVAEADYADMLRLRQSAGEIFNLEFHKPFEVFEGFTTMWGQKVLPIVYIADAYYREQEGVIDKHFVIDVKGGDGKRAATETEVFRIKRKLFMRRYPSIKFEVVRIARARRTGGGNRGKR